MQSAESCLHETLTAFFRQDTTEVGLFLRRAFAAPSSDGRGGLSCPILGALAGAIYGEEAMRECDLASHAFNAGTTFVKDPTDYSLKLFFEADPNCKPNLEFHVRRRGKTEFLTRDTILFYAFHISFLLLLFWRI